MEMKKIIKEEINDFEWTKDIPGEYDVDTSKDYIGIWRMFEKGLAKNDIYKVSGTVKSYDDEGYVNMNLKTPKFEGYVEISMEYQEETGGPFITYAINNEKSFRDTVRGEYEPGKNFLEPVINDFVDLAS